MPPSCSSSGAAKRMRSLRPSPGGHAIWWFVNADSAQEAFGCRSTPSRSTSDVINGQLEKSGDPFGGAARAVRFDGEVVDRSTEFGDHRRGERVRVGLLVLDAPSGTVALEPVSHVEVLLEVMPQRNVQEWAAVRGQFHRSREAALHDGEVTRGQVPVQIRNVSADLDARARR